MTETEGRRGLLQWLPELVMPRKCVFCGVPWEEALPCPECQRDLPWLVGDGARRKVEWIDRVASALRYEDEVRTCLLRLKFQRRKSYLRTLGPLMGQCARDHFLGEADLVTWVPLSPRGLRRRGFDQARELAVYAARALELPLVSTMRRSNRTKRQSRLHDAAARRANVLGAYTVTEPELAAGKRVLVVDDIVTSGATLSECARVLLTAGCREVLGLTLARAGVMR